MYKLNCEHRSIKQGKIADLLLLTKNRVDNIENLVEIEAVEKTGIVRFIIPMKTKRKDR